MFARYYFVKVETLNEHNKAYSYRVFQYRSFFNQPVKAFRRAMDLYDKRYGSDNYLITDFKRV